MTSLRQRLHSVRTWFDTSAMAEKEAGKGGPRDWIFPFPFVILNLSVLWVFVVGWSWTAVGVCAFLYVVRMFGITGFYHRYFSHKTFKTSRGFQFFMAFWGNLAAQRGALWWAAHHRHHHRYSDTEQDPHSPVTKSFMESHVLWWSRRENIATRTELIGDLAKYPELRFLDRWDALAPLSLLVFCYALGAALEAFAPGLGTNGWQMVCWGFVISSVVLFNGVATINSLAHVFGGRRYQTTDDSRNNFLLALITLGEGWHNNHHHYQNSARNGFFWWEIDITYYGLKALEKLGLVWDLKPVPERIRRPSAAPEAAEAARPAPRPVMGVVPGFAHVARSPRSSAN